LSETFTPTEHAHSLRLVYYDTNQVLALLFPWEFQRARISVPARHTRIVRDGDSCRVHMALERCRFYTSGLDGEEGLLEDTALQQWVLAEMKVWEKDPAKFKPDYRGYLEMVCKPVGDEEEAAGSAEEIGHHFFKEVKPTCNRC
jgi:hypothetical protein